MGLVQLLFAVALMAGLACPAAAYNGNGDIDQSRGPDWESIPCTELTLEAIDAKTRRGYNLLGYALTDWAIWYIRHGDLGFGEENTQTHTGTALVGRVLSCFPNQSGLITAKRFRDALLRVFRDGGALIFMVIPEADGQRIRRESDAFCQELARKSNISALISKADPTVLKSYAYRSSSDSRGPPFPAKRMCWLATGSGFLSTAPKRSRANRS